MRWLLIRTDGRVNIYPKGDILPHQMDSDCPCTPKILYLHDEDAIELELDDGSISNIVAQGETTVIMHSHSIEKLKGATN